MEIKELLDRAGVAQEAVAGRVAEVELLDDVPAAWMEWKVIEPGEVEDLVKQAQVGKKKRVDNDKLAILLVDRCCLGVHGLTLPLIVEHGLLVPTDEAVVAMRKALKSEDEEIEFSPASRRWLVTVSRVFRARVLELQETSAVLAAEDALRKKRCSAGSVTAASEGA